MNELRDILNEIFYPDVTNIIVDMLYEECDCCKVKYDESNMIKTWNYKSICGFCMFLNDYRICQECNLFYNYQENIQCMFCNSQCKYYCIRCKVYNDISAIDLAMSIFRHHTI